MLTTPIPIPTPEQVANPSQLSELQARIIWSTISEPGDRSVHDWASASGGYARALEKLATHRTPDRLVDADHPDPLTEDPGLARDRWTPRFRQSAIQSVFAAIDLLQIGVVIPGHHEWPHQLDRLGANRPVVLYVRGDSSLLTDPKKIAIVGSRAATGYGEHMAQEITAGLVDRGVSIVSGAAYGIDGMAHRATLGKQGRTIAVLAGGVDRFYPAGHDALLSRIVESGAVVSELPPGATPTRYRFLQRNRVVAALSDATIVVEASWRSGTLNTAGHTQAIGSPLGAVPGPVTSAASAGCHRLIRELGATCITTAGEAHLLAYNTEG